MSKLAINGGNPVRTKPFPQWPVWDQEEINAVTEVVRSNKWSSIHGNRVRDFEQQFASFHHAGYGICVNSGNTALILALRASGIGPGDEVIMPAYTFIATATAIIEAGAVPVLADIDPETYNLDPSLIEELITSRTRAILPVHFGGRPVAMDELLKIAEKHDLKIIEDAAQAWGSEYKRKKVGTLGNAGCFSFYSSKNITSAEGGIILTNEEKTEKLARSFSNCGRLPEGVWYKHYFLGGNYRMTEYQGALLQVQLKRYPELMERRERNAKFLTEQFLSVEGVAPLGTNEDITRNSYHLYILRYQKESFKQTPKMRFIEALQKEGIVCSEGYSLPVYSQPLMKNCAFGPAGRTVDFPVDYGSMRLPETEKACYEEAVWIPQSVLLGMKDDMLDIVEAVRKIQENSHEL